MNCWHQYSLCWLFVYREAACISFCGHFVRCFFVLCVMLCLFIKWSMMSSLLKVLHIWTNTLASCMYSSMCGLRCSTTLCCSSVRINGDRLCVFVYCTRVYVWSTSASQGSWPHACTLGKLQTFLITSILWYNSSFKYRFHGSRDRPIRPKLLAIHSIDHWALLEHRRWCISSIDQSTAATATNQHLLFSEMVSEFVCVCVCVARVYCTEHLIVVHTNHSKTQPDQLFNH